MRVTIITLLSDTAINPNQICEYIRRAVPPYTLVTGRLLSANDRGDTDIVTVFAACSDIGKDICDHVGLEQAEKQNERITDKEQASIRRDS